MKTLQDRWKGVEPLKCPRCKKMQLHPEKALNALPRRDNETYICSPCGREEGMVDWASYQERSWLEDAT